jgi:phosphoglycolate phosphatase-like HAD superfamily hydrolase
VRLSDAELLDIVLGMNGRPSIVQMTRCADLIAERGGRRPDPEGMLRDYAATLDRAIAERAERVRYGSAAPDEFLVHAARPLLERLSARPGLVLYVLSTTAQERVREEAELLGLSGYFGGGERIIGGTGDPARFSKKAVMERLLAEHGLTGNRLLSIGDGPAEARAAKELGGLAVALCSDETVNGSGVPHEYKLRQIWETGADAAIPDYRDAPALLDFLLGPP